MSFITVVPAADRRVHHEDGRPLVSTGETVIQSTWWRRRLADGDVVLAPAGAVSSKKKDLA